MRLRSLPVFTVLAVASCAHADTFLFSYVGTSPTGITDTISFDATTPIVPIPGEPPQGPNRFDFVPAAVTFDGNAFITSEDPAVFIGTGDFQLYGFTSTIQYILDLTGPDLWTGSSANPSFLDGTYAYTGAFTLHDLIAPPDVTRTTSGTLTVSTVTPEPSSFALLSIGLLGVASLTRRRVAHSPVSC